MFLNGVCNNVIAPNLPFPQTFDLGWAYNPSQNLSCEGNSPNSIPVVVSVRTLLSQSSATNRTQTFLNSENSVKQDCSTYFENRPRRHPLWQRMDSSAACASCAMPTVDESNHSAAWTLLVTSTDNATFSLCVTLRSPILGPPKIVLSRGYLDSGPYRSLSTRPITPNVILIESAIFPEFAVFANRKTDRQNEHANRRRG